MSIETALFTILSTDATVGPLVGGERVYPDFITQLPDVVFPLITYVDISARYKRVSTGGDGLATPRFQIDSWAKTQKEAIALAKAVKSALEGFSGTIDSVVIQGIFAENQRDEYEDKAKRRRRSQDYIIWHEE